MLRLPELNELDLRPERYAIASRAFFRGKKEFARTIDVYGEFVFGIRGIQSGGVTKFMSRFRGREKGKNVEDWCA